MVRASKAIKWLLIAMGSVLAMLLALSVLVLWYMSSGVFGTDSFEREAWGATTRNGEDFTCYRGGMAKDIRDNVLSSNMTKEDVIILLGNPDGNFTAQEYQYVLGMCSGFGFDYDNLHVYFDDQGRFSHAKIIQHLLVARKFNPEFFCVSASLNGADLFLSPVQLPVIPGS